MHLLAAPRLLLVLGLGGGLLACGAACHGGARTCPPVNVCGCVPDPGTVSSRSQPASGSGPSIPGARAEIAAGPIPGGVAAAVDDPDLAALPAAVAVATARPWKVIVLHHSATARGGAAAFDEMHKARGWDGVGYDFVVGNGTDTADGEIETTFRWRDQRDGAHAKGWNDLAIGICLVGNFDVTDPTPAQKASLVRLVRHLRRRFEVPPQRVVGHGAVGDTACPGKRFSVREIVDASAPTTAP